MNADEYNKHIGAIVMNLQALESNVRFFFFRKNNEQHPFPQSCEGDNVQSTSLTNHCQLRKWIRKFNSCLTQDEVKKFWISEEIVDIRDAIAHGRLVAPEPPSVPYTLWKFAAPVNGRVEVKFCEVLTEDWLTRADSGQVYSYPA
jgi:hypothetical protein